MGITIQKQHSGRRLSEASSVCTADPLNELKESIGIVSPKIRLLHFQNLQAMDRLLSPRAVLRAVFLHRISLSVTARTSQVPGVARLSGNPGCEETGPSSSRLSNFRGAVPRDPPTAEAWAVSSTLDFIFNSNHVHSGQPHMGCYFHYTLQTETQPPTGQNLSCVNF